MTVGGTTTYYSYNQAHGWRTSQGPQGTPNVNFGYTATGRLSSYGNSTTGVSAAYTYDAAGQRTQSQVTISGQTTTSNFTYEGLLLKNFAASQSGGTGATSWEITYLYDENGRPYAGVYRQPANTTSPWYSGWSRLTEGMWLHSLTARVTRLPPTDTMLGEIRKEPAMSQLASGRRGQLLFRLRRHPT